jgi:hypothetical protein
MRYLILLLFAACMASPNIQPAVEGAAMAREVFLATTAGTEALVRRSNPPQATLDAYLAAAARDRQAYEKAYQLQVAALGSLGVLTPEQINQITNTIIEVIHATK